MVLTLAWLRCICAYAVLTNVVFNVETACLNETEVYNKNLRPVKNYKEAVVTTLDFTLLAFRDVNFQRQTVELRAYLGLSWTDEFVSAFKEWNSPDVNKLSLDPELLWLPDIQVGSEAGSGKIIKFEDYGKVVVYRNGLVNAWSHIATEVEIDADITNYPFDTQEIRIGLYPWSLTTNELLITIPDDVISLKHFTENGEWETMRYSATNVNESFGGSDPYSRVLYTFVIRRKWLYPVLNTIAPIVLTSFLNCLVFLLPMESGERVTLNISAFLTLAVFLTILNDILPKTSDRVSILVIYLSSQMVGSVLTIGATCVIANLYYKKSSESKSTFYKLASKLCCMDKMGQCKDNVKFESSSRNALYETEQFVDEYKQGRALAARLDNLFFWLSVIWNFGLTATLVLPNIF